MLVKIPRVEAERMEKEVKQGERQELLEMKKNRLMMTADGKKKYASDLKSSKMKENIQRTARRSYQATSSLSTREAKMIRQKRNLETSKYINLLTGM